MSDIQRELLAAFDAEYRDHLAVIRQALARAAGGAKVDLREVFRRAHSLKGAARAVDLPSVEEIAHQLETLFSRVIEEGGALTAALRGAAELALDTVEAQVAASLAGAPAPSGEAAMAALRDHRPDAKPPGALADAAPAAAAEAREEAADYLRVSARQVDGLSEALILFEGELQAYAALTERRFRSLRRLQGARRQWERLRARLTGLLPAGEGQAALQSFEHEFMGFTREALAENVQDRRQSFALDRAAANLRQGAAGISLVGVGEVFSGLGRVLRDAGRDRGQEVEWVTRGFDILADRRLLQALKDPVLHLLRNAVSHGGETREERLARAKPEKLTVELACAISGGHLVVTVSDDGRGPDLARIEEIAVGRGLLPARSDPRVAPPTERLLSVVFTPGFSTAAEVDRLAGRGLGLSIVAEAVRKGQGHVVMSLGKPWGTRIALSMPLSSAARSILILEAGNGHAYGVPTGGIERLLRIDAGDLESVEGRPAAWIEIDGQNVIVPVIPIERLVEGRDAQISIETGAVRLAVLRRDGRRCALAVAGFKDARVMTVDGIEGFGADHRLVSGAVLVDGQQPVPVLDPGGLFDRWLEVETGRASAGLGLAGWTPARARVHTILVVDDSITTRTLEKSILEAQGYRVALSVDGMDALSLLRSGDAVIDLVIADVEMPRLDGFGLLQAIRNDAALSALPVILMTSRAEEEDVRRGLDLGADAYMTKQKFDQRELLAAIGQLL